jgi:hyperosmotically inducible protein
MQNPLLMATIAASCVFWAVGCDNSSTTPSPSADSSPPKVAPAPAKPDNTAANKDDRTTNALTPMDQSESSADIKITADIRRGVMDDKSLSMDAHNAKIIANKGSVTLRGVVDTAAEKDAIETQAKLVAGVTSVDNQLTVKVP